MFVRFDHLIFDFVICFAKGVLTIRDAVEDIESFPNVPGLSRKRNDAQPQAAHGGKRVLFVISFK